MKLVIPYFRELRDTDARMVRLAEFVGVSCVTLALTRDGGPVQLPDESSCLAVNPEVIREWLGQDSIPANMVNILLGGARSLLVYALRADPYHDRLVETLSQGALKSVGTVDGRSGLYEIAADSRDICEAFAGISFGPVNHANDHVLRIGNIGPEVQQLISIGGQPFMAAVKPEGREIFFVAGEDVVDIESETGAAPLAQYFSRFIPLVMALRYAAGEECWRPSKSFACVIIDDPLLRETYGFLNFRSLLHLANQHNFHASIAFIPHNFKRNSPAITHMFLDNPSRLSISFHGNDHTDAELASTDTALLDTLMRIAVDRMDAHKRMTGLSCDRVMVVPQGKYSAEALRVLKIHNFHAVTCTICISRVAHFPIQPTIAEWAQPAVLRYEGFPLFLRRTVHEIQKQDIAFNLFFGRPTLLVEHHDIFQNPDPLLDAVDMINSVAPDIEWSNLDAVVTNSTLVRRAPGGEIHIRAYSNAVRIANESPNAKRYTVEWDARCGTEAMERLLAGGTPLNDFQNGDTTPRITLTVASGRSQTCSLQYRNPNPNTGNIGVRRRVRAFVRRRLSEVRDNYLSKNQHVLSAAKAFQRRFLKV